MLCERRIRGASYDESELALTVRYVYTSSHIECEMTAMSPDRHAMGTPPGRTRQRTFVSLSHRPGEQTVVGDNRSAVSDKGVDYAHPQGPYGSTTISQNPRVKGEHTPRQWCRNYLYCLRLNLLNFNSKTSNLEAAVQRFL